METWFLGNFILLINGFVAYCRHQRKPEVYTRAILDFNFGAAPVGSEPCVVQLMLENTGTVSTDWLV